MLLRLDPLVLRLQPVLRLRTVAIPNYLLTGVRVTG